MKQNSRNRPSWRVWLLRAGIGLACLGGLIAWQIKAGQNRDLAAARAMAGLAPYPPSVREIYTFCNWHPFWTGYYVRFTAPPGEINAFLAASLGLKAHPPETFSLKHPYLPLHDDGRAVKASAPWFDPAIRQAGRRYSVQYNDNNGEVVVDDVRHIVYVYVYDS